MSINIPLVHTGIHVDMNVRVCFIWSILKLKETQTWCILPPSTRTSFFKGKPWTYALNFECSRSGESLKWCTAPNVALSPRQMAFLSAKKKNGESTKWCCLSRWQASTSLFIQAVVANLQLATSFCVEFKQFHLKDQALVSVINGTLQPIWGSSTRDDRGQLSLSITHILVILCVAPEHKKGKENLNMLFSKHGRCNYFLCKFLYDLQYASYVITNYPIPLLFLRTSLTSGL